VKVGFVPLYNIRGPSSRYRVFQFIAPLSHQGFSCSIIEAPEGHNRKRVSYPARLFALALQSDVLYIQKRTFPSWLLGILQRLNPHIIFDLDDAIYLQSWNSTRVKQILQMSRVIVAGNQVLADFARQYNENITILPTVVDTDHYQLAYGEQHPGDPRTVLGWIGTDPNRGDLVLLKSVFDWIAERYARSVVLRTVGRRPLEIDTELEVEFVPWTLKTSIASLHSFDIGLMPLENTPWNRGKCGLKLIEYLAVGTPAAASPVGVNSEIIRDGETGFLANNTADWQKNLACLIEDKTLRSRLGQSGRQHVEEHYSIQAVLPRLIAVLEGVVANREQPV
jgi:glycosyltransferase involved in cell wall biosynthesis